MALRDCPISPLVSLGSRPVGCFVVGKLGRREARLREWQASREGISVCCRAGLAIVLPLRVGIALLRADVVHRARDSQLLCASVPCCSEAQPSASARACHNLAISSSTTIVIKQSVLKLPPWGDKIWAKNDLDALALTKLRVTSSCRGNVRRNPPGYLGYYVHST